MNSTTTSKVWVMEAVPKRTSFQEYRDEFYKTHPDLKYDIGLCVFEEVFEARLKAGISQSQLARKIGTKQPAIARIENGAYIPSLRMVKKIADALGYYVQVKFIPREQRSKLEK